MPKSQKTKMLRVTAIVLLIILGLNALIAGALFIADPSGVKVGMSPDALRYSPFSDFLIPGIILALVNGVLSIVIAILSIMMQRYYPLLITVQGLILMGWILIQIGMLRLFAPMHAIMIIISIALITLGLMIYKREKA